MATQLLVPKSRVAALGSANSRSPGSTLSPGSPASLECSLSPVRNGPTICRVCAELAPLTDLVNPCACSGKHKYVHMACLLRFFVGRRANSAPSKNKKASFSRGVAAPRAPTDTLIQPEKLTSICPSCKATYVGPAAVELGKLKLQLCQEKSGQGRRTATASSELADVYKKQARYEEALQLYRETLAIHEDVAIDANDPELAVVHNKLGACLKNLGHRNFAEAETHFKHALRIREQHQGPGHVDVATAKHNLATLLQTMHRFDEGMLLAKDALDTRLLTIGKDHAATQVSQSLVDHLKRDILRASLG